MITNFKAAKNFVNISKQLDNHESISGPGSSISNTLEVRLFLREIIDEFNIKTILDLGCGDWNWFRLVDLSNINYEGWDADVDMISSNQSNYGKDNISFKTYDIVLSDYPEVDLIICRDVLFHMPIYLANKIIKKSKLYSKYFLSTSFRHVEVNKGIDPNQDWGYYSINLNIEPFNLGPLEISYRREMLGANPKAIQLSPLRFVSLYDFSNIRNFH
jgi:SAM-dependent methyltransferase